MNPPDISEAEFTALLEEADSKYYAWHLKELRPEWDRRMEDLLAENLTSGGRAFRALDILQELLQRAVSKRVGYYAGVARKRRRLEMFSKRRLGHFRERIMTSVELASKELKDQNESNSRAVGDGTPLPHDHRYVVLEGAVGNVVAAELRVLQAKGQSAPTGARAALQPTARLEERANKGARKDTTNMRAEIEGFISKLLEAGHKITRTDFWTVAGYKDRTEFERFQRGDARTTKSAAFNFNRVLKMNPEDFMRALAKKKSLK